MTLERQYVVQGRRNAEAERVRYAIEHMRANKAYRYAAERAGGDPEGRFLEECIERYRRYRTGWRANPQRAIAGKLHHEAFRDAGLVPLCVDIETAAVCDLACSFCYRQWIATPDKLMRQELYEQLIDQCAELGVPSVKLNWRGEPMLHPKLPQLVEYAKRAGILEALINTNAVTLTEQKARALIEAGLDVLIYSFDGGTKETYERMRVARVGENPFEQVYENIRRFARLRAEMGSPFPRTQIQMILTRETFEEQDAFFALFSDCVDDVTVKAYTERGGSLPDLDPATRKRLEYFVHEHGLSESAAYWHDMRGTLYVSAGRLPCEQPFQRLMVTHDGRVSMCCYDWGSEYPIGYVDAEAFEQGDRQYEAVLEKAKAGSRGFEKLANITMPKRYVEPPTRVQTLREIWYGDLVNHVRQEHVEGRLDSVPICHACPFKETYRWVAVPSAHEPAAV